MPFYLPAVTRAALPETPRLNGLEEDAASASRQFVRTASGLQIEVVSAGTGAPVRDDALVSVKYVLRRANGYFIDASYGFDRFETYTFRKASGDVVRGFDQSLDGLREGARVRFIVPPQLGYVSGCRERDPGPIPPDFGARRSLAAHRMESLVFEVAIVRVR